MDGNFDALPNENYTQKELADKEVRAKNSYRHPIKDSGTIFVTSTTTQIVKKVVSAVRCGNSGILFHGYAGIGKTIGIQALAAHFEREMPEFLFVFLAQHTRQGPSIKQFFSRILVATGHPVLTGDTDAREQRVILHLGDLARRRGGRCIIFVVDEMQGMQTADFFYLKDQMNDLEQAGFKVIVFGFGESPALMEFVKHFPPMGRDGIESRFWRRHVVLSGLGSAEDIRQIFEQIDTEEYPTESGFTFTRWFVKDSWDKHGFRLATQAQVAYETMVKHGLGYINQKKELAARTVFAVIRCALELALTKDGQPNPFDQEVWDAATEEGKVGEVIYDLKPSGSGDEEMPGVKL